MKRASLVTLFLTLGACGGAASPGSDAGAATPDVPPSADSRSATFGPDALDPGEERTLCVVVDLGNETARQVRAVHALLPTGSHHMIVYRTSEALRETPFPCSSFETGTAILGVQTPEADLVYPDAAGLAVAAHQHIRLEVHEINYTTGPIEVTGTAIFDFYPEDEAPRAEVVHLFTGNTGLLLPAHETTTVVSFHPVPDGAHLFGMASHTHALGVHATIHRATSETEFTTLLHESYDWASPPFDTFAPALELAPSEGLRLECTFENTSDRTVSFGLDFADEMCFLGAYYYE